MTLTETLARRRVTLGFVSAVIVLWAAQPTGSSIALGTGIACAGEALRIWAAGHLQKSREVTVSGPYHFFSHPLYVGSSVMGVGLAVATHSLLAALIIAGYLAVTITAAIRSEEAFLHARFGDAYVNYVEGRRAADVAARARPFRWQQAIANREHRAVAGLALSVLLLILKATYNGSFWGVAAGR